MNEPQKDTEVTQQAGCLPRSCSAWSGEVPLCFTIMFMVILLVNGANLALRAWWAGEAETLDQRLNDLTKWAWSTEARLDAFDSLQNPESGPVQQSQSQSTPAKTGTFSTPVSAAEASVAQSRQSSGEIPPSNPAPPSGQPPAPGDQSHQANPGAQPARAETQRSSAAISPKPREAHSATTQ